MHVTEPADSHSLREFISGAERRFTNVHLAVRQEIDYDRYRDMLSQLGSNPSARAVLPSLAPPRSPVATQWRVWLSRPYRRKVDYFRPPGRLTEMAGGDAEHYWQAFPARKTYYVTPEAGPLPAEEAHDAGQPAFWQWLPPAVTQMLDPSFIWEIPEGYEKDPEITPAGPTTALGREALSASLAVGDWGTRAVTWSEVLLPAERYELIADKATGVLLQARGLAGGQEVSKCTVESIVFGIAADPNIFRVGRWVGQDWVSE
jgi:hypothetical protein